MAGGLKRHLYKVAALRPIYFTIVLPIVLLFLSVIVALLMLVVLLFAGGFGLFNDVSDAMLSACVFSIFALSIILGVVLPGGLILRWRRRQPPTVNPAPPTQVAAADVQVEAKQSTSELAAFIGLPVTFLTLLLYLLYSYPDWWSAIALLLYLLIVVVRYFLPWFLKKRIAKSLQQPPKWNVPIDWRQRCTEALLSDEVRVWEGVTSKKVAASYLKYGAKYLGITSMLTIIGTVVCALANIQLPDFPLVAGLAILVVPVLYVLVRKPSGPSASELRLLNPVQTVTASNRPPILYLRSFDLDSVARRSRKFLLSSEGALSLILRRFGPVIAIGRPGEAEPMWGAARFYVDDASWQKKIEQLVPCCQLVVWTTGHTGGLQWEIEHLVRSLPPERLLLWLHVHIGRRSEEQRRAEWTRTINTYQPLFPKQLPADVERTYLIGFDSDWKPIPIPDQGYRNAWWDRIDTAGHYKMSGLMTYLLSRG